MTPLALAFALAAAVAAPPEPGVVASAAGLPITAADLEATLGGPPTDRAALGRALDLAIDERLLASEAHGQLGEAVRGLSPADAARALAAVLFDPGRRCAEIPEGARRQHYADTVWRFVAPPAHTVDDLQLLCCKDARACDAPEVRACVAGTRADATALRAELPTTLDEAALRARFEALRPRYAELYLTRYTFYHDPARPDAEVHGRLQTVDRPIATAGATLAPGALSPVVETRFGHHVLRLAARRPAVRLPFDDPRTQALLRTELCPAYLLDVRRRTLADLRRNAPVEVYPEALREAFPAL